MNIETNNNKTVRKITRIIEQLESELYSYDIEDYRESAQQVYNELEKNRLKLFNLLSNNKAN